MSAFLNVVLLGVGLLVTSGAHAASGLHEVWEVTCQAVSGFHDGDTFTCDPQGGVRPAVTVRPAGFDAPETGQAHWRASRDRLRTLAGSGTQISCYKTDRYGREVCRVRAPNDSDVVEEMLREGLGWHFLQYIAEETPDEQARYAKAERAARAAHRGLWSDSNPLAPWECRHMKRKHGHCH
jgi:endonuclease YncB( thermonuclease family)